jgi:hypothetical protein
MCQAKVDSLPSFALVKPVRRNYLVFPLEEHLHPGAVT